MTNSISLDLSSGTPPYEQVRSQLAGYINAGILAPGDRLPVVRALAADLGIATNTIARAYRELAADGLVEVRRRTGTVVRPHPARASEALRGQAHALVRDGRGAGFSDQQILDLVQGTLHSHRADDAAGTSPDPA